MTKKSSGAIELHGGVSINVVNEPSKKTTKIFVRPTSNKAEKAKPQSVVMEVGRSIIQATKDKMLLLSGVVRVTGGPDLGCILGSYRGRSVFIFSQDESKLSPSERNIVDTLRGCGSYVIVTTNRREARSLLGEIIAIKGEKPSGEVRSGQEISGTPRQQRSRKSGKESGKKQGGKGERCQKINKKSSR
jgi:hypothetical protein